MKYSRKIKLKQDYKILRILIRKLEVLKDLMENEEIKLVFRIIFFYLYTNLFDD